MDGKNLKHGYCEYVGQSTMLSRFQNAFPSDASKAFGKHTRTTVEPSRFQMGGKEVKNPEFSESAMSAFGKRIDAQNGSFQEDASYAFGKKPIKDGPNQSFVSYVPSNSIAGGVPSNEWSSSALRKVEKPFVEIDPFPSLSSIDMFPPLGSSPNAKKDSSPKVSFVDLVKKRAEDDAKEAEEVMKRELKQREILTKRQEEVAQRKLVHAHYVEQSKLLNRTVQDVEQEDDIASLEDEVYPDHDDDAEDDGEGEGENVQEEDAEYEY